MKKFVFGMIALAATPAMAADFATKATPAMPAARPIYDWTGLYLGINGGGGRASNCWTQRGYNVPILSINGSPYFGVSNFSNADEGCSNGTGTVVGGQIGYRQQVNSFVFGIEAQGDWANISGSNSSPAIGGVNKFLSNLRQPFTGAASLVNTTKVDAIGMFTGQVGYSFGTVLLYAKGGVAVTDNKYSGAAAANVGTLVTATLTDAGRATKFGGVAGAGLEWMFAPGWSLGAEYNHLFMGNEQVGLAYTGNSIGGTLPPQLGVTAGNIVGIPSRTQSISQDLDIATIRLNYSFGH